jgi:hypothetical protein
MDYQKVYNLIVDKARNRVLPGYTEKHHILPKCMGGSNERENVVSLTAKEHYLCHRLLCEIYPKNKTLKKAYYLICTVKTQKQKRYTPSGRVIERVKLENSLARRGQKKDPESILKRTQTRRKNGTYQRTSESVEKGIQTRRKNNSYGGKPFTESHKQKLSEKKKKIVYRIDNGIVAEQYNSITEAAEKLQIKIPGISKVVGKGIAYRGYMFRFEQDVD